jgi:orotidine-5'-phosphate decarboxylase
MIIERDRSIVPACDVSEDELDKLVKATADVQGVGAYKVGMVLAMSIGLPRTVEIVRRHTDKPIIYDHQKAGTDIPETGHPFMRVCREAGVDAVILFPQAGPVTETAWIRAAKEEGLGVIVGGLMTHQCYTEGEGGYLADQKVLDIYLNALKEGVTEFVVPGTKIEAIHKVREMLEHEGAEPTFYSPGLIKQGGDIKAAAEAAGKRWHAIVGRALYGADDMHKAAEELVRCLG